MSTSKIIEYINDELHTRCQPIVFTDLMNKFHIGSSNAKQIMYNYYKETTTMKFNCIIMICYRDSTIKMVTDLSEINTQRSNDVVDCFIYAFSPNKEFIPVYELRDQSGSNLVVNQYQLVSENEQKIESVGSPIKRSQTVSEVNNEKRDIGFNTIRSKTDSFVVGNDKSKIKINESIKPKKSTGLKSTEILAKMRKARDEKEAERQRQLKQRRQEEEANKLKRLNNDPTRKAQMEDLSKLFVDNDEDEVASINRNDNKSIDENHERSEVEEPTVATANTATIKMGKTINDSELESLLDTTAEESLLEIKKDEPSNSTQNDDIVNPKPKISSIHPSDTSEIENTRQTKNGSLGEESIEEIVTSYVDEDGYIVTNRKRPLPTSTHNSNDNKKNIGQSSSPKKVTSRASSILSSFGTASKKGQKPPRKKVKQGSIESFFKRS